MSNPAELRYKAIDVVKHLMENVSVDDVLSVVDVSTNDAHEIVNIITNDMSVEIVF